MTVLTIPIALVFLAIFVLGSLCVMWAVDRHFPMTDKPKGGTR